MLRSRRTRSFVGVGRGPRPAARTAAVAPIPLFASFAPSLFALMVLPILVGGATVARADGVADELVAVERELDAARADHLGLIAPRHFDEALEKLRGAREQFDRGGRIESIRERLRDARAALVACDRLREMGRLVLGDAIEARSAAVAADAARHAAEAWATAEESARRSGRALEDGDQRDARRAADRARMLYGEAELQAIRNSILGAAREERRRALELEAADRAPTTLGESERLLAEADRVLLEDRYRQEAASRIAAEAAAGYRHAARIARDARKLQDQGKLGAEHLIRGYESGLADIAAALQIEPRFDDDGSELAARVVEAIAEREADRRAFEERIATLEAQIAELESRVGRLSEREAQLRDRERRDRTIREVQALFTPAEAEVLPAAQHLTIRLLGLSFPPGSSEIRPEYFTLLSKLLDALRRFDKHPVRIEGHTDASGDARSNEQLSQERANALREYVLANTSIAPEWLIATGHGENRPIASNETAEGRAQNRRIDVIIDLVGM